MSTIQLDSLRKAVKALEIGFAEHASHPDLLTVRDGVIQRFEIAMDLSWKITARVLREVYGVQDSDILTKKDIFRQAAKYRLLDNPEAWFGHYDARNDTSHQYDNEVAERTFARARLYLADAQSLLQSLTRAT
jgi:nucleotidyltransferase substrate binding protein (TIGR01987 family)